MSQAILEALALLDPKNDGDWTGDGLPRLDVLKVGTRAQVTAAAPNFTRGNPTLEPKPKEVEVLAPLPPERTTSLRMESTEFGDSDDDEEDEVFTPPDPKALVETAVEAEARLKATRDALEVAKRAAEAAEAEVLAASREHDAAVIESQPFVPPHVVTQNILMGFLHSTQKVPQSPAQIDKVMARKQGYGIKRPVFTPRKD
jgi:hypothetical protein